MTPAEYLIAATGLFGVLWMLDGLVFNGRLFLPEEERNRIQDEESPE